MIEIKSTGLHFKNLGNTPFRNTVCGGEFFYADFAWTGKGLFLYAVGALYMRGLFLAIADGSGLRAVVAARGTDVFFGLRVLASACQKPAFRRRRFSG